MNQKSVKSPRNSEDNLLVLVRTLQWQGPVCFVSSLCHAKIENIPKKIFDMINKDGGAIFGFYGGTQLL